MDIPVSLIIPNFNKEEFLETCLKSVFGQSALPREIVLVDDASTDGSQKVLRRWAGQYPQSLRLHIFPENKGVGYARNWGIRESKQPFLTTLDSDDFFLNTEKLESEWNVMEKAQQSNAIAFSGIQLVDNAGHPLALQPEFPIGEGKLRYRFPGRSVLVPRDFLFPRSLLSESGLFNESLNLFEDFDFKLRLSKQAVFLFSGNQGIGYRQSDRGLSKVSLRKHLAAYRAICRWNFREEDAWMRLKMFWATELGLLRLYRRHFRLSSYQEVSAFETLLKRHHELSATNG